MAQSSLPRPVEQYHGTNTSIKHQKRVKGQTQTVTEEYKAKIIVKDGQMQLFIQKNDQRLVRYKQESQMRSLTSDVLLKLIGFLGYKVSDYNNKKKQHLVEFMCSKFGIPTTESLKITDEDVANIIQNQQVILQQEPMISQIIDYIENHQTNLSVMAEILEILKDNSILLDTYIQTLWVLCVDNFKVNHSDDLLYKKTFQLMTQGKDVKQLQQISHNLIGMILHQHNQNNDKNVKQNTFWYALNVLILKYFNYCIKTWALSLYVAPANASPTINDQMKCQVYKLFGSTFRSLQKLYKGKNYGDQKSLDLLAMVNKCLLTQNNNEVECKEDSYLDVPLRLRLENRGFLRLISKSFYDKVAVKIYSMINMELRGIITSYDSKKVKQIEHKILNDSSVSNAFNEYIGSLTNCEGNETEYKQKVLKDLSHGVVSRLLLSIIKRNKIPSMHIGQFRTGIKAISSKACT